MRSILTPQNASSEAYSFGATWPLWLFSVCIVSLTFKQLRADSFAGPAEWLTAIVALALVVDSLRRGALQKNWYILGAALTFGALLLGGVWALLVEPQRVDIRETAAHVFTFLVVVAFLALAWRREATALAILACVISFYLTLIQILAIVPSPLQSMMIWVDGQRLQGLSDNPNQIALLAIASLVLLVQAEMQGQLERKIMVPLTLSSAAAGFMSGSGAFIFALLVTTALAIAIMAINMGLFGSLSRVRMQRAPLTIILVGLLVFGVVARESMNAVVGIATFDRSQVAEIMEAESRQGYVRIELWEQALAVGAQSPLIGFGPGLHLNPDEPTSPKEAHNTLLDVFVFSGLVGIFALGALGVLTLRGAFRNGHLATVLLMGCAIVTFAMFHYTGRHPVFWIVIFATVYAAGSYPLPGTSSERQEPVSCA